MRAILHWFRRDLRRRWRSLLVLALLIAFASGAVMTAVAGARRGGGAVDRLLDQTLPATVEVVPSDPGFDWDLVRGLPQVAALAQVVWTAYGVDGVPGEAPIPVDDRLLRVVERPVVLQGRLADSGRPDEAVVTPGFVETWGKGVGDTVTIDLYQPETLEALWLDPDLAPDGPRVEARIVGVVRSFLLSDAPGDDGVLVPSAGLFAGYSSNLLGASGGGAMTTGLVRLRGGGQDVAGFATDLALATRRSDIDVWPHSSSAEWNRRIIGFEANGLLAFGAAAAVAAVFLIGQAVARQAATAAADLDVLRGLGMSRWAGRWAAALGPVLAALGGATLGGAIAVGASTRFPYGVASALEPAPGVDIDVAVLVSGLLATLLLVAATSVVAAGLAQQAASSPRPPRRSAVASWATRHGVPVPLVVGTRFALEPGQGKRAVPVRSALFGAMVGVVGVVAALTFSGGIDDAMNNPARYGQVHQLEAALGVDGEAAAPAEMLLAGIAGDPEVIAVNDSRTAVAPHGGVPTTVYSLSPVSGRFDPVLTEGRAPSRPDEIVFGPFTAQTAGVVVGDRIDVLGTRDRREFTVTGLGFVPEGELNYYQHGAWVTGEGFDRLFDGFLTHSAHIVLRPDADPVAALDRLRAEAVDHGGLIQPAVARGPAEELQQIRRLPVLLAWFLAILALGAIGHALALAVRRRRHDLAVLRAVGMTRRQTRWAVMTQASVLALVGVVVGVPLGAALGRVLWRYYSDTTMVHYLPPVAMGALLLALPLALLAANLLALWPAHRAVTMRVGQTLRSE